MSKVFSMITTGRSHEYTRHALHSFFAHTEYSAEDTFILIDNNNDCPSDVYNDLPQIEFQENPEPLSYAENMNRAFDCAIERKADLYLLNNDIIFSPEWIIPLDIVRPCIISPVCNMQFQYSNPNFALKLTMNLSDYLGREEIFLQFVKHHRSTRSGYQLAHSFPFYCVRIPYSVHSVLGKFDTGYSIAGWEDVDYILRSYLAGFPLFFAMNSFILHFYGKSTWAGDSKPDAREQAYLDTKAPQYKFEEKWSKELSDLFGLQTEESMQMLFQRQEQAVIDLYANIIREFRPKK